MGSEGEGTSLTKIWGSAGGSGSLSHFHKFLEIAKQKVLLTVERGTGDNEDDMAYRYVFAKDAKIEFNEKAVAFGHQNDDPEKDTWGWLGSKRAWAWSRGESDLFGGFEDDSRVQRFNRNYGRLLLSLQEVLGCGKLEQLGQAVSLMRQLQVDFNVCLPPQGRFNDPSKNSSKMKKEYSKQPIAPNWVPPFDMLL